MAALDDAKVAISDAADAIEKVLDLAILKGDPLQEVVRSHGYIVMAMMATVTSVEGMLRGERLPLSTLEQDEIAAIAGTVAVEMARKDRKRRGRYLPTLTAVGVVVCASLTGWFGYRAGLNRNGDIRADLSSAFRDGAAGAATWTALMRSNNIAGSLANCDKAAFRDQATGRKVCSVPLFIDTLPGH